MRRHGRFDRARILRVAGIVAVVGALLGVFLTMFLFAWYAKDLPNPNRVVRREGYSTKIVDRDGGTLYDLFTDVNRTPVHIAEVPLLMKQATIAIEDKDFYQHEGFSVWGMIRGFSRLLTRGRAQGGSTLTQQLTKNVLLTSERSLPRKFKELVLSLQIERKFSKDEILQMYLNEAPYGGTAIGLASAAERYFGKATKDLNLTESAILAGMPQAPSRYSPYGSDPKAYVGRAEAVLRRMREDGYISKEQEEASAKELPNVKFREQTVDIKAPHFVFYVRDQLTALLGAEAVEQGGFVVTTTLDSKLQDEAQAAVKEEVDKLTKSAHVTNGAALVVNPNNGEILAMVGSKDYFQEDFDGKFNVVTAKRQPGSAIKPVTYALAFNKGYSPATMLLDVPTKFPGASADEAYEPQNYDGKFRGPVQLRFALGSSLNIPAVKLLSMVGLKDMLSLAYEMGLSTLEPTADNMSRLGLSVTLGGGEVRLLDLTTAYSAFANGGLKVDPVAILKIERDGKTIYEAKPVKPRRVLPEETAFLINHVLYDNNARLLTFGPNSYLNMGNRAVAVKTGTTNSKRDNWTVGWSTNAIVGVWVGNNDNSPMTNVASGVTGASPIWRRIMVAAWDKYKGDDFVPPTGVESRLVDTVSGYPEHDGYPSRAEYFTKGTVPTVPDPIHTKVKVCRVDNNKLASEIDVARGEYDEREYYVLGQENGAWQDDIAAWVASQDDPKYKVPTEYCSANAETVIGFGKPHGGDKIESNDVEIALDVVTSRGVQWVKLYLDGVETESFDTKTVRTTLSIPDGVHELKGKVKTDDNSEVETVVKIGVKVDPNASPLPSPLGSPVPSP